MEEKPDWWTNRNKLHLHDNSQCNDVIDAEQRSHAVRHRNREGFSNHHASHHRQEPFYNPCLHGCQQQQLLQQRKGESAIDAELSEQHLRRSRTNFSTWQLESLERAFHVGHYPDAAVCSALAMELSLPESRIQVGLPTRHI
jgi:Homeodomain